MANNMDLRKTTDYRSIAEAILNKYEVLQGIIFRKMLIEFKNDISKVKPAVNKRYYLLASFIFCLIGFYISNLRSI
jgi:hypothetical protein